MHVFDSGDEEYLRWVLANRNGIVINTNPSEESSYVVFHQANCRSINNYQKMHQKNAFTQGSYIKVCSSNPAAAVDWAKSRRGRAYSLGTVRVCKTCNPQLPQVTPSS